MFKTEIKNNHHFYNLMHYSINNAPIESEEDLRVYRQALTSLGRTSGNTHDWIPCLSPFPRLTTYFNKEIFDKIEHPERYSSTEEKIEAKQVFINTISESAYNLENLENHVANGSKNLKDIAPAFLTARICLAAVTRDGEELRLVPEKFMTETVLSAGINNAPFAIRFVPEKLITEKLALTAVCKEGDVLGILPKKLQENPFSIKAAILQNGLAIKYVPEELQTRHLIEIAVSNNPFALQYIPTALWDEDLLIKAALKEPFVITLIGEKHLSDIIIRHILSQDTENLSFVPLAFRTYENCSFAVSQNGIAIRDVPSDVANEAMDILAVSVTPLALKYLPKHRKTLRVCEAASTENPQMIEHAPPDIIEKFSDELLLSIITRHGAALQYLPQEKKTKEWCLIAIKNDGWAWLFTPPQYYEEDFFKIALITTEEIRDSIPLKYRLLITNDSNPSTTKITEDPLCPLQ